MYWDTEDILILFGIESKFCDSQDDFRLGTGLIGKTLFPGVDLLVYVHSTKKYMCINELNEFENLITLICMNGPIRLQLMFFGTIPFDKGDIKVKMILYLELGINGDLELIHKSNFILSIEIPDVLIDNSLLDGVPSILTEVSDILPDIKHDPSVKMNVYTKESRIMHLAP